MNKKAVIFGTGSLAEVVQFYLDKDSEYQVEAFTATDDFVQSESHRNLPLVPFSIVEQKYSPDVYDMFIAIGYANLNQLREKYFIEARDKGFKLLSYVNSKAIEWGDTLIGENVFIFENNTIQPFVSIGDGTILWSGNHIGHHSNIGSFCFITSHVVVSGHCCIGSRSFIGVNATIVDDIEVAEDNLIGPSTLIQKHTKQGEVYLANKTTTFSKPSSRFFR